MLILLSSKVSWRYYEFTIGYCNNDNVDNDIESLNTSMGGEKTSDDSSKHKQSAGLRTKVRQNMILLLLILKLLQIEFK